MWNRITGKSTDTKSDPPSHTSRRNDYEQRSKQSRSGSIVSSNSNKKFSAWDDDQPSKTSRKFLSRGDDRDRGFNPTSTSFSSSTRSPYPGIASASVATASGNHNDEPYIPPGLVRNASLADQMPKSRSSRAERAKDEGRDPRSERRSNRDDDEEEPDGVDHEREKKEKRGKRDKDRVEKPSRSAKSSKIGSGYVDNQGMETSRGPADFSDQVEASGFSQFPGQYSGGMPNTNGDLSEHPMSSHVQDQFPGQFPSQSTAPYRPPIATSEGGPGLAAEYYGDAGESVAEQPGNRANPPSLIIGAEPHLQAALAVAAPPPEPSASGGIGAAASFFSGEFDEHGSATSHSQQTSSTFATIPDRPQGSHHSSSTPAVPTVGGAAMGAAAGYFMGSQASSLTQRPSHAYSVGGAQQGHDATLYQRPPSPTAESYYSNTSRPPRPDKQSSQSSNAPLYAAGAAGLAAAAYQHSHQTFSQHTSSKPQNPITPMAQQHRNHGPLEAVVDFFKDPEGVAQFEEYSEIIGVCRYCFAPGSSAKDAPRKHYNRRKRSNESLGRVDKETRYHSPENERRRKKDKSWLATSLAGYGLAKVGESLFKQKNDFDDTYSVKTGHYSPDGRRQKSQRRSQSKDHMETGITSAGKVYKKDPQGGLFGRSKPGRYDSQGRSRSRSQSRDRKSDLADATIGAAIGPSMAASSSRRQRSTPPKDAFVNIKRRNEEHSPNQRRKSHKEKKRGFFSLSSANSSFSSVDMVHRSSKRSSTKSKDDKKAEAAILGLGAAAAALSLNDGRNGHKKKRVKELVGVKRGRGSRSRDSRHDHRPEDEVWESAPEDEYESADSALAYGGPRHKGSRESLSSDASGTNKWGWRWGSKEKRRDSPTKRESSDHSNLPAIVGGAGAGIAGAAMMSSGRYQSNGIDADSSLPLQQVFPISTSDPTLFDVGGEASVTSFDRPAVVPIQHPQPITPVSATLYSSQPPYERSYSAPTGPPVFSQNKDPAAEPAAGIDARSAKPDFAIPSSFAQNTPHAKELDPSLKLRRRDSSPARFGDDAVSSSMASHRRASIKDDTSAVRFDRTEEQEKNDRHERRRKRREDRERHEAEEQEQIEKERRATKATSDKKSKTFTGREESPQRSSETSWAAPAAAGVIGAAIGAAALAEKLKSEETREERRERRRRERDREEAEDQEATRKRERRRKERERERERDVGESVDKVSQPFSDDISGTREDSDRQRRVTEKRTRILQAAASPKRSTSHEDYSTFFRPLDLGDSNDQVKVTSANANADVDFDQTPAIVTVVPKGFRDPDAQPTFSPADTDDIIDTSRVSFPVPRLRLVEPTPPSSRGSTPIMWPKDTGVEDIEEPPRDHTPSKVPWGANQTHEYTVISPDGDDEHEQPVGAAPGKTGDTGLGEEIQPLDESALPRDTELTKESPSVTESKNAPVSFGDDAEFAATLAASAEDAGFDPSIIVDNPMYRRRDSPPGSDDRSMPGGFDDDEMASFSRRDESKKDREAVVRDAFEDPNGRDDNAAAEDIISQLDNSESRILKKDSVDNLDDSWGSGKKSKSKKSKKTRKQDFGSKDEYFESSESVIRPQEPESGEIYESPTEDTPCVTSSAPLSTEGGSSSKSRRKSKRDSIGFDDTASSVSAPSTVAASRESKSKSKSKKSSVWDRVLGRSPQENGTTDLADEANMDEFEEPKKKSKKSKGRRSTRDEINDEGIVSKWSATVEPDNNNRPDVGGSISQDQGRITQDPPAKDSESSHSTMREAGLISEYSEDRNEPEVDQQLSESFLDMRPEPPPPPDKALEEKEPPDPFAAADLPVSPQSSQFPPNDHNRQHPQIPPSDPLPSPTAVPFDFRFSRPRPSIRSARSMSQTPPSSPHVAADLPPQTKPRPRSTEFKSSDEFRPLMLVERHRSHQESASEGAYPSLPSSHTTSRSSSVHDPEEEEEPNKGDDYEMTEASHGFVVPARGIAIITSDDAVQSDLLDSQQATPTASSFQRPTTGHDGSPLPGSRSLSPQSTANEHSPKTPSIATDAALGAVVGGAVAFALHKLNQDNDQPITILPQLGEHQIQQGLDSMVLDRGIDQPKDATIVPTTGLSAHGRSVPLDEERPHGQAQLQQSLGDVAPRAENTGTHDSNVIPKNEFEDVDLDSDRKNLPGKGEDLFLQDWDQVSPDVEATPAPDDDALFEEDIDSKDDFTPKTTRKGKNIKRKLSKPDLPAEQAEIHTTESTNNSKDTVPDTLSPEETRQIQEQDAQDAVDSWFAPSSSSKKDKKKKRKGTLEHLQESSEPIASIDSPRENPKSTEPNNSQTSENLIRGLSSDQVVDSVASVAQDVEDVEDVDENILQPATMPNQDATASLLERRQGKSKSKKGKKGLKSRPDGDAPPPTSLVAKDASFEQLRESGPQSAKPATEPKDLGIWDERRVPPSIWLSPEAIPLPLDEDLDLSEKKPQESNVLPIGQLDKSEFIALPEAYSEVLPIADVLKFPTTETTQELLNQQDKDITDDSFALPLRRKGKKSEKAGVGTLEDVTEDKVLPPEKSSDAATWKQNQDPAQEPSGEMREDLRTLDDERPKFDNKRKGKKGKNKKQGFVDDRPVPPESPLDVATLNKPQGLAEEPVDEMSKHSIAAEDEWAGFSTKTKEKKGKRSKRDFMDDSRASAHSGIDLPVISLMSQDAGKNSTRTPAERVDMLDPQEEPRTVEDEWVGFGPSKAAKKVENGRRSTRDDTKTDADIETSIPLSVASLEIEVDLQTQDSAGIVGAHASQQEPDVTEGGLIGFSGTKKEKKAKEITQDGAHDTEKSVKSGAELEVADATPQVIKDVKSEDLIQQDELQDFAEEPQAVENGWGGFSSREGKEKTKIDIPLGAQENSEIGAKSHLAVTASGVAEGAQAGDSPFQDIANPSQQEPLRFEDEWVGSDSNERGKKDKNRKSKTLDLDSEPLPAFAETRQDDEIESDPLAAPQSTTSTSREVAAVLAAEESQVSNNKGLEQPLLTHHKADRDLQELTVRPVLDHEERILPPTSVGSKASEPRTLESEVIDQCVDEQYASKEDPEIRKSESQELELIGKYDDEEPNSPTLDSSNATTNTAKAIQHILEDETIPNTSINEGATAASSPTVHGTPTVDQALELAEPDWDMPKKKKGKKSKQRADSSLDEAQLKGSLQTPTPSAEVQVSLDQDPAVEGSNWNVPKKKKGKKGREDTLMPDEPRAMDSLEASTPPVDVKVPLDPGSKTELVNKSASKKSKDTKNKRKGLSRTLSDYEAVTEGALVPRELGIEDTSTTVQDKALSAEQSFVKDLQGQRRFEPSAIIELIQASDTEEVLREGGPESPREFEPLKSKKAKKKGKKAEILNWEDEEYAAPAPQDDFLAEPKSTKDSVRDQPTLFDNKLVDERAQDLEVPRKFMEVRKTAENSQPSSLKGEDSVVSPEPVASYEVYQPIEEAQTKDLKGDAPSRPDDPTIANDLQPPVHAYPDWESKEQSKESTHESASLAPVSEQGPAASNDPEMRPEELSIGQPFEDAESSLYSLESAEKNKRHAKKARAFNLNDNETQQELNPALEELDAEKMQDEPSTIPMSEHRPGWSEQNSDRSIEEIEPTKVVEPSDTPLEIHEHEDHDREIIPLATKTPVNQSIEVGKDDSAPVHKSEEGKKHTKESYLTSEPETDSSHIGVIQGLLVTAGSGRSEQRSAEELPRRDIHASGERQSTPELSKFPTAADHELGEPSSAPESRGSAGPTAEDGGWDWRIKNGEKATKSNEEKSSDFRSQIDRFSTEGTQDPFTNADLIQGEEPTLEEQTSGNPNIFDEVGNAPSFMGTNTREPSALPEGQKTSETKMDDGASGIPINKGKKGKISKREKLSEYESKIDQTFTAATPVPIITAKSGRDDESILKGQPYEESNASMKISDVDPIAEKERKEPPSAQKTKAITESDAEDKLWGIVSKTGKQGKKQRKDAPRFQEDLKITDAASSGLPEAVQDPMTPHQDGRSNADVEASTMRVPDDELLDPQEQYIYDQEYARELERQGVDIPQSSKLEMPTSVVDSEVLDSQWQVEYNHDHAVKPERGDHEASQRPTLDLPTPFQETQMQVSQESHEHQQEHTQEFQQQDFKAPRSPTSALPNPAAEPEQPDHGPEYSRGFNREDSETSQIPTIDFPNTAADIVMLDAQEQREYDNEYAKELERQLSPFQGERSDLPADEAYISSTLQPSIDSMIPIPLEERTPLALPSPLEDIVEESSSRSSSVQGIEPNRDDDISPFLPTKKSKKGKKGKKQQQPIIWEDDTATPPVETEANQVTNVQAGPSAVPGSWEPGASDQPADLEELIERRSVDDSSIVAPTNNGLTKALDEADDYFAMQPGQRAEEDVERDLENDEFRRSLSNDIPDSTKERPFEQETLPNIEGIEYPRQALHGDEAMDLDVVDRSYQPKGPTLPTIEEVDDSLSYAPAKKNKKDKKGKRREVESDLSPPTEDSKQVLDQSRRSGIQAVESFSETSAPQVYSTQYSSHRKEESLLGGDESRTAGHDTRDTEVLAATAGLGAVAALAAEGLARRGSKKGSKKDKKGKKAFGRADLKDESPNSESPVSKGDTVVENAEQDPDSEKQSGIRAWQKDAEQAQTLEQQSVVRSRQDFKGAPFQSPTTFTTHEPLTGATGDHHPHSQTDHSTYRDSGINISNSPVISEEVPVHRSVRDSGYPETESSPILVSEPQYQDTRSEGIIDHLYGSRSKQDTQEYDQSHRTPERRMSISPSTITMEAGPDDNVSISQTRERQRRSRSYNSDDSGDSGFDVQRRRRRQAIAKEAREPSPVSPTTKDRSSALFSSSPSARENVVDRPREESVSTRNDSIGQEPTWSFDRQGSSPPVIRNVPRDSSSPYITEPVLDPSTYDKLTGRHADSSASLFGGPVRQDEDIMSGSRSPPSSEIRGRRGRLNTISEDSHDRSSLHAKDEHAFSDVGSPEAGVKEGRMRSPLATDDATSYVSTEAPKPRQPGPAADEEQTLDDLDSIRGPNTEQVPGGQGDLANMPNIPPKQRDGEHRTASAASVQSDNSIHAIIRTPDQIRSASGQSYRSSGTPPLRRVDRSVSGDLRGASKLGEGKLRAKTSEAELDSGANIPSSSTYDPVTDKGKSRADMADVYEGWGDVRGQSPMSPTRPPSMRKRQSIQLLDLETRLDQLVSENRLLVSQKSTAERTIQEQTRDYSQQRLAYEEALEEHKVFLAQKDSELDELRGIVEDWQNKVTHLTEVDERLTTSRGVDDEHDRKYGELEAEHLHLRERHRELTTGMEALVQREVTSHLEAKNSELQRLHDELDSAKQQVRSLQQQLLASRESEDFIERDEDYFDSQCQSLCQHVQQWVLRFSKFSDMKACYRASEIRDETKLDRMENAILDGIDVDIYLQDRVKRRDVFMAVVMTMIFDYIFTRYLFGMDREQRQKLKTLEKTLQEIGPMSAVCKWRATTLTLLMKREDFARQRTTDTEAIVHEIYDTLATFLPPPSHLVAQIQDSLRKVINSAADLSIEMRTQRADYQMLPPLQPDYDTNGDLAQKVYFNALTMNERSGATTSNQALQEQGAVVRMVLFPLVVKNEEEDEQIIVCPAQVLTADPKAKKTVRVMSVQGSTQGGRSEASFAGSEGGMF